MRLVRRSSAKAPSGWLQAVIFNAMLVLIPVLAANVVAGVFSIREFPSDPTIESIVETRSEIDKAFRNMPPRGADPRSYWSDLVDRELRARDMAAARGFLLAAPQLLDERDRKAIASASDENGSNPRFSTEDERVAAAALLFLPNDVRARYETATRPPEISLEPARDEAGEDRADTADTENAGADPADETAPASPTERPVSAAAGAGPGAFSVLGRMEDLARNSREWLAGPQFAGGQRDDGFELRLTGLGLVADEVIDRPEYNVRQAASLLRSAHRAGRLTDSYTARLEYALDTVLPPATLRTRLNTAFEEIMPTAERSRAIAQVFVSTLRPEGMTRLLGEVHQLNRLEDAIGPVAALGLIEHVASSTDMRRARLIADAGGDRAVALEKQIGSDVLDVARTGVKLSRSDVLEIMGLAAAAMAVFWMALATLQRSLSHRRQGFASI
ncbi:MAG: hypothetical protein GVY06_04610 [Alphaproteobacteria bacterium]|nr:hypothetical protein [Alphaproteobacteria bacterium]